MKLTMEESQPSHPLDTEWCQAIQLSHSIPIHCHCEDESESKVKTNNFHWGVDAETERYDCYDLYVEQ